MNRWRVRFLLLHKSLVFPVKRSLRDTLKHKLTVLHTVHAVEERQWLQFHRLLCFPLPSTYIHLLIPLCYWHLQCLLWNLQLDHLHSFIIWPWLILRKKGMDHLRISIGITSRSLVLECLYGLLLILSNGSLLRHVLGCSDQSNQGIDV